ncbi:MAG: 2-oxoglutarate dehydrogenase E1 component [Proteobacteria bacterium]|nr:2-oxoglutarate dehydrogenase E1 component [Pseudomonadota bacterium]
MLARWEGDPTSVPASWQAFFEGVAFAGGMARAAPGGGAAAQAHRAQAHRAQAHRAQPHRAQAAVDNLITAYRRRGYRVANTDPLGGGEPAVQPATLTLEHWGLGESDLERGFDVAWARQPAQRLPLREIVAGLRQRYCGAVGVEYMHIEEREPREWVAAEIESAQERSGLSPERRRAILQSLTDAELFEKFTHSRYPGQKRFSLEGGETLIPALHAVVELGPTLGVREVVLGMAHRGRLNVLANVIGMSYETIFSEFEGNFLPESFQGDGDVKYHKGYSADWVTRTGERLHLSLTANPSHLEAVSPVVQGRVRAKQRRRGDTELRTSVLPLLLHGDAAFAGQGVVAETLNLSRLPGYRTGGTLHVVINNQIGFTTTPEEGRSTRQATDVAKIVEAPTLHVNGDDPEAMVGAIELALRFRQQFHADVVIDMLCYRRHGHNEGDDPALTQPMLYAKLRERPSVRELYLRRLVAEGVLTDDDAQAHASQFRQQLEQAHESARRRSVTVQVQAFGGAWEGFDAPFSFDPVATGVTAPLLQEVAEVLCRVPAGFRLNPKVARQLPARLQASAGDGAIDWSFAELLAFGTLLREGTPVRLSGQDSARGTFSQRHAVWQHMDSPQHYVPLNELHPQQAHFCVYNSTLSEAAVLGFEYGYALSEPGMLILWEAQFGDFVNGAQVIVDQFILGAESKWQRGCGLVLLLPHGYEGQGPEHSNAYLERFLQGCARQNVQVCVPSTPAQYFHLLRRQVRRAMRLPLIVMTPKSLLRHPRVVSPARALCEGGFAELLPDPQPPARTRRLVLCCGKLFWELFARRETDGVTDVALLRLEQLYPLNEALLRRSVADHAEATELVWAQEEPQNRGAWSFLEPRLRALFPDRPLGYVGREASASPATGSLRRHREEQEWVIKEALYGREAGVRAVEVADDR